MLSFLTGDAIINRSNALHAAEPRNPVVFSAMGIGQGQRVHLVVDVRDGDVALIANHVLAEEAGVNVGIVADTAGLAEQQDPDNGKSYNEINTARVVHSSSPANEGSSLMGYRWLSNPTW